MRGAAVGELGSQDLAVAQLLAIQILFLEQHAELVAGANLEREIDVPAEDGRHLHDLGIRQAGLLAVDKKRRLDDAGAGSDTGVECLADFFGLDLVVRDRDPQAVYAVAMQLQFQQFVVVVELKA